MEDRLRLNTKLFGFDGIIGRRDYFLNSVYITCFMTLITLPVSYWIYANAETMDELFNASRIFLNAPILIKLYAILGTLGISILSVSNIFRRLNDICGRENRVLQTLYSILIAINVFYYFLPPIISYPISFVTFIFGLIILFKKGKITSKYPYDFRKEFNWGAFLGTWIWGLFNRTYVTLWQLVIGLTPWAALFALICGLKGNEWAYNNKKCTDVDKFNRSQEKQATVFAVLTFLVGPILYFLLIFGIVGALVFTTVEDVKNNPEKAKARLENFESGLNSFTDTMVEAYFEEYEIVESENKFYVLEDDWKYYMFSEKKDILDLAATTSAMKRREEHNKSKSEKYVSFSKSSELPRTKIYGYETRKLLGEFDLDMDKMEKLSFSEVVKASVKAYKFYKVD